MGMTMTQKILAAHAGLDKVEAGQLIKCKPEPEASDARPPDGKPRCVNKI